MFQEHELTSQYWNHLDWCAPLLGLPFQGSEASPRMHQRCINCVPSPPQSIWEHRFPCVLMGFNRTIMDYSLDKSSSMVAPPGISRQLDVICFVGTSLTSSPIFVCQFSLKFISTKRLEGLAVSTAFCTFVSAESLVCFFHPSMKLPKPIAAIDFKALRSGWQTTRGWVVMWTAVNCHGKTLTLPIPLCKFLGVSDKNPTFLKKTWGSL